MILGALLWPPASTSAAGCTRLGLASCCRVYSSRVMSAGSELSAMLVSTSVRGPSASPAACSASLARIAATRPLGPHRCARLPAQRAEGGGGEGGNVHVRATAASGGLPLHVRPCGLHACSCGFGPPFGSAPWIARASGWIRSPIYGSDGFGPSAPCGLVAPGAPLVAPLGAPRRLLAGGEGRGATGEDVVVAGWGAPFEPFDTPLDEGLLDVLGRGRREAVGLLAKQLRLRVALPRG